MSIFSNKQKADYTETLHKGISFVRNLRGGFTDDTGNRDENLKRLKDAIENVDAIVIGAGAGLSTAAGYTYSGERFDRWFFDFKQRLGLTDMYSGGFYPFPDDETRWAFWARNIYINRFLAPPKPVYDDLLALVRGRNYFVITTNVDHCFQKAGFEKKRLFYTQGDYGLFQCSEPCHSKTYENEEMIRAMVLSQGWVIGENNELVLPEGATLKMAVPTQFLPVCPVCGKPLTMNLRSDDKFVEDEGWHQAAERYENFLRTRGGKVLFLELGVGYNTPVIIKYPFWNMTGKNPDAVYACINYGEAVCPEQIRGQSICVDGDIGSVLADLSTKI